MVERGRQEREDKRDKRDRKQRRKRRVIAGRSFGSMVRGERV